MSKGHSSAASFYGTFMAILLIIAVLVFVDLMLVGVDRNEREQEAERYYQTGEEYLAQGDYNRAVDNFRSAFSIYREETRFQLAYADALYRADRLGEAESSALDLLNNDPVNAEASLILARIRTGQVSPVSGNVRGPVSQSDLVEGINFYHRAIFGTWTDDPAEHRLETRLELADLLAANDRDEELLAELLPLGEEAIGKLDLTRRIAGLYADGGAPERSAALYRAILEEVPDDAAAHAGLGEAEFQLSNYRNAKTNFETALRYAPEDTTIARRLTITNRVLDLDPMGRNLTSADRYQRSLDLLQMTLDSLTACVEPEPDYAYLLNTLSERADETLLRPMEQVDDRNDAVEDNLDLADQIWSLRVALCGEANDEEEPIALVLTRAAQ